MVKLRGHHLLCLQFFKGKGYNSSFLKNLKDIIKRLKNEKILIIKGADDICNACPYLENGKCTLYPKIEQKDLKVLEIFDIKLYDKISWEEAAKKFKNIPEKKEKFAFLCQNCPWYLICWEDSN